MSCMHFVQFLQFRLNRRLCSGESMYATEPDHSTVHRLNSKLQYDILTQLRMAFRNIKEEFSQWCRITLFQFKTSICSWARFLNSSGRSHSENYRLRLFHCVRCQDQVAKENLQVWYQPTFSYEFGADILVISARNLGQVGLQSWYDSSAAIESVHASVYESLHSTG